MPKEIQERRSDNIEVVIHQEFKQSITDTLTRDKKAVIFFIGPPATGKSTMAETLIENLYQWTGKESSIIQFDWSAYDRDYRAENLDDDLSTWFDNQKHTDTLDAYLKALENNKEEIVIKDVFQHTNGKNGQITLPVNPILIVEGWNALTKESLETLKKHNIESTSVMVVASMDFRIKNAEKRAPSRGKKPKGSANHSVNIDQPAWNEVYPFCNKNSQWMVISTKGKFIMMKNSQYEPSKVNITPEEVVSIAA